MQTKEFKPADFLKFKTPVKPIRKSRRSVSVKKSDLKKSEIKKSEVKKSDIKSIKVQYFGLKNKPQSSETLKLDRENDDKPQKLIKSKTVKNLDSDSSEKIEQPDLDKTMDFLTVDFKP